MSGMGDAHTHLSWNGGDLARLGELDVEEHTLLTAKSAQCYLDSGYTMSATPPPPPPYNDFIMRLNSTQY